MIGALSLAVLLVAGLFSYNRYRFKKAEARFPPTGQFVTVEGIRLHYISKGTGRPIVFLHGGILSGNDYDRVMALAADRGYRAIAFDRPGYGYSERPNREKATPAVQARLLHGALKELGIEKPVLVGHSWSGVLLLTYALNYPKDVAGLVALGAGMYKEGYPAAGGDPVSSLVTTPLLGPLVLNTLLATLGPLLAGRMLRATFAPEAVPESYRKATRALWLRPGPFKANREDVLAFVPAVEQIRPRYKEIGTATVIVVGGKDPFETKSHSFRLHAELPHSQLLVLPHAGHMIPQCHPESVMEAVEMLAGMLGRS